MNKIIAVVPIFNEEKNLQKILGRISRQVDLFVCVNDGSKDRSLMMLQQFAASRKDMYIVDLPVNGGMAGAIRNGFLFVLYLLHKKVIRAEDAVVTIDADGQHKPEYIENLVRLLERGKYDVLLTRRDFSVYPIYKIWGNRFLTWTNSILSGFDYADVESGLRVLKVKTLAPILRFYTGFKYSCAQEIALISAREGFRIDNSYVVKIAYYRAGTTVWDGFIVLYLSVLTFFKWKFRFAQEVRFDKTFFDRNYKRSKSLWPRSRKRK